MEEERDTLPEALLSLLVAEDARELLPVDEVRLELVAEDEFLLGEAVVVALPFLLEVLLVRV